MAFENMDRVTKEYTNGEITVVWKPKLCDHSAVCISELPMVFDSLNRPWIHMDKAPTSDIQRVVDRCPTAAISWYLNTKKSEEKTSSSEGKTTIKLMKDGPILVSGNFELMDEDGNIISCGNRASVCRCTKSKRLPFCDGSHK
jgi:uncharacterized Fe-S cluster protein YjdI